MQQRNGRKSLTTVQGLPEAFDYKKILKALKKGERHLTCCPGQNVCCRLLLRLLLVAVHQVLAGALAG